MSKNENSRTAAVCLWVLPVLLAASTVVIAQQPVPPLAENAARTFPTTLPSHEMLKPSGPATLSNPTGIHPSPRSELQASPGNWVQPAAYRDNASFEQPLESPTVLDNFSIDQIRESIKQKDAGTDDSSLYGRGMTLVLDEKGKKYIRFLTWNQVWTSFTDNNPGTVDAYGVLKDNALDIALRRSRFLAYSQLSEKYLILLHMGINNQSFTNGGGSGTSGIGGYGAGKKPQIFVHDVWSEYTVLPESEHSNLSLSLGAGLHYWNGISRKSSSSTLSYMTLDAPVFNWPNIELTDQFGRQLGWYAKGKFRKLDYRVSVNHPFNADNRGALNDERAVNIATDNLAVAGYFDWQLWDQESNLLPYKTSSYFGKKSVFNLGAGFYIHPDASGILDDSDQLQKQQQLALGFDCYFDTPVGDQGAAITLYNAYYVFDYGDNYYRDVGILNTGTLGSPEFLAAQGVTPTISGPGNAQPLMGTGEIFYLEGGYVLPNWILHPSHGQLQPFAAFTHKNLEWLDDPAFNWDMGLNYLIDGHHAKVTFQYSLRPQFIERTEGEVVQRVSDGHAGQFTIQAQIAL